MKTHIELHNVVDQVSRPNFCGGLIKYHHLEGKKKIFLPSKIKWILNVVQCFIQDFLLWGVGGGGHAPQN